MIMMMWTLPGLATNPARYRLVQRLGSEACKCKALLLLLAAVGNLFFMPVDVRSEGEFIEAKLQCIHAQP